MARFRTDGIDDIIDYMEQLEQDTGPMADAMLMAGAEQVKLAWKKSAQQHNLRDTGDMINSINYARQPHKIGDMRAIDIYPQGKDRRGTRNAEKAAILHFGVKSAPQSKSAKSRRRKKKYPGAGIPATHWVDDADAMAAPLVEEAMRDVMARYIN